MSILLSSLLAFVRPAWSNIIYNYTQDWMFDSTSGLYWQIQQIPSATFVPSSGSIATSQQLSGLVSDATGLSIPSGSFGSTAPGPFSSQIANLLSFFESDAPSPNPLNHKFSFYVDAVFDDHLYNPPPDIYNYAGLTYSSNSGGISVNGWSYNGGSTLGPYGPLNPCGSNLCPATEPAFVVSTTPPVPLPASIWLLLSGIGALEWQRRVRMGGKVTPQDAH